MLARSVERPRCIAGSATFTTEPSIKLRLLPRMVTGSTHRVSLSSLWAGLRGGNVSQGRRCGPSKAISRVLNQARTYPIPHRLAWPCGMDRRWQRIKRMSLLAGNICRASETLLQLGRGCKDNHAVASTAHGAGPLDAALAISSRASKSEPRHARG